MPRFDVLDDMQRVVRHVSRSRTRYSPDSCCAATQARTCLRMQRQDPLLFTHVALAALAVMDAHRQRRPARTIPQWRAVEAAQRLIDCFIYHSPMREQFRRVVTVDPPPWLAGAVERHERVNVADDPYGLEGEIAGVSSR